MTIAARAESIYALLCDLCDEVRAQAEASPTQSNWNAVEASERARANAWTTFATLFHPSVEPEPDAKTWALASMSAQSVNCPFCSSQEGYPCAGSDGDMSTYHASRIEVRRREIEAEQEISS